jgi:hypothetical protein
MEADIKREFERLHREIKALKKEQEKSTWVSCSWVTDVTGWNKSKLQMARQQKLIEFKESPGGGYLYKLESIPEIFIKQKQAS